MPFSPLPSWYYMLMMMKQSMGWLLVCAGLKAVKWFTPSSRRQPTGQERRICHSISSSHLWFICMAISILFHTWRRLSSYSQTLTILYSSCSMRAAFNHVKCSGQPRLRINESLYFPSFSSLITFPIRGGHEHGRCGENSVGGEWRLE